MNNTFASLIPVFLVRHIPHRCCTSKNKSVTGHTLCLSLSLCTTPEIEYSCLFEVLCWSRSRAHLSDCLLLLWILLSPDVRCPVEFCVFPPTALCLIFNSFMPRFIPGSHGKLLSALCFLVCISYLSCQSIPSGFSRRCQPVAAALNLFSCGRVVLCHYGFHNGWETRI